MAWKNTKTKKSVVEIKLVAKPNETRADDGVEYDVDSHINLAWP